MGWTIDRNGDRRHGRAARRVAGALRRRRATRSIPIVGAGLGGAPPPPPPPGAAGGGAIPDSGRVHDDWSFTVVSVFGAARVRAVVPDGWTVKAILHDGRDIADTPIELKSGETLTDVQVVVSQRVTSISGQLLDDKGAPLVDGTVIVFADDASRWSDDSRWVRAVRPDQEGRYQIQGLPPGDYLAVAVDYVEEGAWNEADYLESLRARAQRVPLRDAESRSLSLKPITPRDLRRGAGLAEPPDDGDDFGKADRLVERRGRVHVLHAVGLHPREHDDRNAGEAGIAALLAAERPAVHHRHAQVQQDDARACRRHAGSGALPRRSRRGSARILPASETCSSAGPGSDRRRRRGRLKP